MTKTIVYNQNFNVGDLNVTEPFYEGYGFYIKVADVLNPNLNAEGIQVFLQLETEPLNPGNTNQWKLVTDSLFPLYEGDTELFYIIPYEIRNSLEKKRIVIQGFLTDTPIQIYIMSDDQKTHNDIISSLDDKSLTIIERIDKLESLLTGQEQDNQFIIDLIWEFIRIIAISEGIPLPQLPPGLPSLPLPELPLGIL